MNDEQDGAYHKIRTATRVRPSGCPMDADFTTFTDEYLSNPYPTLKRLRDEHPIFFAEQLGYLVVTRMEDVSAIFRNHELYSSENVQDPVFPVGSRAAKVLAAEDFNPVAVMSNRQQPDHTRIRKYTQAALSGRRMRVLEPYMRQRSEELADALIAAGGPIDFVSAFGHPLPGKIIFRLIGFDEKDDDELMAWTANRLAFTWGQPDEDEQVAIAENMLRYWRYCREFVKSRRTKRGDDLTSELLDAHETNPDDLSYREVESIIYGLSFAGHEIVSNFLSNTLICLLKQRDTWNALRTDPNLIPNALEEVLRFESPQTSWRRVTRVDTEFEGAHIPAGTQIFLSLGAANHDPEVFDSADQFDILRSNARKHISLGQGIHFCLGARMARMEGEIAITTLTQRIPSLRLVDGQSLDYAPNITFRGPKALMVVWD